MEIYKIGKIVSKNKRYIIFESNNCGDLIYVNNINKFKVGSNLKLFIYKYQNEYINNLYGFSSFKERILFDDLLSINGVGPKTALSLLKEGEEMLINIIANKDLENLNNFQNKKINKIMPLMLKKPLKNLGFNQKQINFAIKNVKPQENIETLIEESIKIISNAKFS